MGRFGPMFSRTTFALLLTLVLLVGLAAVSPLQAEMISSQEMEANNSAEAELTENIETIDNALDKKVVQNRLEELGYTAEEIRTRLERLSGQQAEQLAERVETLDTGGDLAAGNSTLLGILLIVLIVILIV